ncbi:uncharacterized protein DUF4085 [Planomicrobium soli]|uniref:Uncharacterized protein DUF4085 n=1 Tax=Planomicrobium soli TaxID=1176648 RepID=A0A2P8H5Q2_9BACL|nr:DUF4085 family protein [Planomicrobium soli]PSL41557.1 uncharacterized protein DUF4085 [Planomicrobium soli]
MKYFTKDWYEEMQVFGFLTFHETLEEWEEELAYYKAEGIDYKEINRRDLEEMRADLLKFLPESFYPYIHDGTINSGFPTQELRDMAKQWEAEREERMEALFGEYNRHYESIKDQLPAGAVQLVEESLHDATVISVEKPSDEVLIIQLDCRGCFHYFTDIELTFTGVTEANIPEEFEGAWWLYDEMDLTDPGFELQALFDSPRTEVKIVARDVKIEVLE